MHHQCIESMLEGFIESMELESSSVKYLQLIRFVISVYETAPTLPLCRLL